MIIQVTPSQVAKRLSISERRVRQLLTSGRMMGVKQKNGRWLVNWPLQITSGKRGPDMTGYPTRL
jgi:predicted site-specific integrase-resolvase